MMRNTDVSAYADRATNEQNPSVSAVPVGIANALRKLADKIDPPKTGSSFPIGAWLCTKSLSQKPFSDFTVGKIYQCVKIRSSLRIIPDNHTSWSPYWQFHSRKFCYDELSFEYLGDA